MKSDVKVIISGGGTGGHIFPAIAIANALKNLVPGIEILFVGAIGRMEMEKVPASGYPIEGLNISGFQRSLKLSNLKFPFKLISSLIKARKIIYKFKPQVAVGVGGYASGPLLYMATRKGIPGLIQEQNSYPGITNKLLAGKVEKICVAYDKMEKFFPQSKIILTGNPVREEMVNIVGKRSEAFSYFGLDELKPVVLIVGGSQGARSINIAIKNNLSKFIEYDIQIVWQCGKLFYNEANEKISSLNKTGLKLFDFINRMDLAYACADVIVSRAGASTVSELCIIGKPAILVPLPTAAEDHQTHNCKALVEKDAAILIHDNKVNDDLVSTAIELLNNTDRQEKLSKNISALAVRNAAETIAKEVMNLVKN